MRRLLLSLLMCCVAPGAELPSQLSPDDIGAIVGELSGSGAIRLMRSAEAYPKFWPGLKVGVEFDFLFAGGLEKLGAGNGNVPTFIPQPKFYLSKGLFYGVELIFSFFPGSALSTLGSTGGIVKWTFYDEIQKDLSVAGYVGYTSLMGLNGTYHGSTFEAGVYGSKDFVRLRPYLGIGFIRGSGEVPLPFAATADNSSSTLMIHTFLGCEFNLPVSISAQLDLYNMAPRAAIFFGKKF